MLVDRFCYVQVRIVKLNLIQNPPISTDRLAGMILSSEFDKKPFANKFNGWLSRITSYHILIFNTRASY